MSFSLFKIPTPGRNYCGMCDLTITAAGYPIRMLQGVAVLTVTVFEHVFFNKQFKLENRKVIDQPDITQSLDGPPLEHGCDKTPPFAAIRVSCALERFTHTLRISTQRFVCIFSFLFFLFLFLF